ncbi:MAG: NAD-dependent epimerase/dehydratase family protein [Verrucomicrobiales bacterium]|nr:NAD-dependent epimerase/dehydratase family protein [Verrucomicrobiales bacterium]
MRISFIGGTVFIGHAAAQAAVERGHKVTVIHRGEHPAEIDGVESLLAERTQTDALRAALHASAPDAIVDTLAMTAQDARNMIDASRELDVPVVVLSSQDVYAQFGRLNGHDGPEPEPLVTENSPLTVPYPFKGISEHAGGDAYDKKDVEAELREASDLRATVVLRLPATYGSRDPQRRFGVIVDALDRGVRNLPIRDGGKFRWTHSHVANVAHAIALGCEARLSGFHLFNVGEAGTPTMKERADLIASAMGTVIEWRDADEDLQDAWAVFGEMPNDVVVDSTKIREQLGFTEILAPDACLEDLIDGLRRSRCV